MKSHTLLLLPLFAAVAAESVAALTPAGSAVGGTQHTTPDPAVARIVVPDATGHSLGSGVLVLNSPSYGLVLTNWHVVRDAVGRVTVAFPSGFTAEASIVRFDRDWDLAALLIAPPPVAPVPIADEPPRPGDHLWIAGYGSGRYRMVSGRCTQYVAPGPNQPFQMLEVSAPARQGDSGGPIFNDRGQLVGILFGSDGRTTVGSYCGRLQWFTQLALADLSNQRGLLAAIGQPAAMPTTLLPPRDRPQPTATGWIAERAPPIGAAASAGSTAFFDPTGPLSLAGSVPTYPTANLGTSRSGVQSGSAAECGRSSCGRSSTVPTSAGATGSRVAAYGKVDTPATGDRPLASNTGWVSRAGSLSGSSSQGDPQGHPTVREVAINAPPLSNGSEGSPIPTAIPPSCSPPDVTIGFEQVKSLLAVIGAVLLVLHGLRFLRLLQ